MRLWVRLPVEEGGMRDLTVQEVRALKSPGVWRVSRNLYLQVADAGSRSWLFRYMLSGVSREMGLGSCDLVTLAEAREKVFEGRRLLLEGIDPIEHRRQKRLAAALATAVTFK